MKYCLKIDGMGCAHCIRRVTEAMNAIGANIVSLELNNAIIDFREDVKPVREAIEDLGFDVISIDLCND